MTTVKTLELAFITENDKTATISIDMPKEPVDLEVAKSAMDTIIEQQVFTTTSGKPIGKKSVRIVERSVEEYEL